MIKITNSQAAQIYTILSNEETTKVENFFDKIGDNFYGEDYNEVMNNITKAISFMKEVENYKEMLNSTNMELRKYQLIVKGAEDKVIEENNRSEGAHRRWSDETKRQQQSEKMKAAWKRRAAAMA